jgi:hypothetical protein
MVRHILVIATIAAIASGCGASAPPVPPTGTAAQPSVAASASPPTPPPAIPATAEAPTQPISTASATTAPPGPAVASAPTVVYQRPSDGSIEAIDTASDVATVLADPTTPMQRLPFSVSPDGRTLALISGRSWLAQEQPAERRRAALWAVDLDGTNPRKLLDLHSDASLPVNPLGADLALTSERYQLLPWTPNGRAVLVASAHEGQVDLYLVPVDGGAARRLTATEDLEFQAHVSPDGQALAYGSAETFGTGAGWGGVNAWAKELDGTAPTSIMIPLPGQFLATGVELGGWTSEGEILARAWSDDMSALTLWAAARQDGRTVASSAAGSLWAVAGGAVAYTNGMAGGLMLWAAGTPGGAFVADAPEAQALHLSPDGRTLIVCAGPRGQALGLYVVNNGELRRFGTGACELVAWTDDGQRFAASGSVGLGSSGLIVGADGGVQHALPVGAAPIGWLDQTLYFFAPLTDGSQRWQLYRTSGPWSEQIEPIGAPIADEPAASRLVRP